MSDHRRLVPLALEKSPISFDREEEEDVSKDGTRLAKIDSKKCPFETFHLSRCSNFTFSTLLFRIILQIFEENE